MKIRHQILSHFIIRTVSKFFDDKCTDNYTYRCVRSKCYCSVLHHRVEILPETCLKNAVISDILIPTGLITEINYYTMNGGIRMAHACVLSLLGE